MSLFSFRVPRPIGREQVQRRHIHGERDGFGSNLEKPVARTGPARRLPTAPWTNARFRACSAGSSSGSRKASAATARRSMSCTQGSISSRKPPTPYGRPSTPEGSATLDRLHHQMNSLARRFEPQSTESSRYSERLGKELSPISTSRLAGFDGAVRRGRCAERLPCRRAPLGPPGATVPWAPGLRFQGIRFSILGVLFRSLAALRQAPTDVPISSNIRSARSCPRRRSRR